MSTSTTGCVEKLKQPYDSDNWTPAVLAWTTPTKQEIVHSWVIKCVSDLCHDPQKAMNSLYFISISKMKFALQAKLEEESLLLSLKQNSNNPSSTLVWVKDCSFSIRPSTSGSSDIPTMTMSVADQQISDDIKGVSIPLTKICGGSLIVQFKGTLISNDYKQTCVEKFDFIQYPPVWMKRAFDENLFSDAQIKVGQESFNVHKVILALASQVFKKMFESDMKEQNGVIEISDFDPAIISDLLMYIYTGEAPNLKTLAKELLFAADKYDLQGLVFICMQQLETDLTFDNVAEVLLLADRLSLENPLRSVCVRFIQENLASVSQSKSWRSLMEVVSQDLLQSFESTPTQVSATSIVKEDISYQWVIFDAKVLHTAKAKVKGPRIHSKILPLPVHPYLVFTEKSIIFQLCDGERIHEKRKNVFVSSCTITIMSMETKQSICSVEVPSKKVVDIGRYDTYGKMGPISATILDDGNFTRYLHDETLTIQVLATLTIDGEYYQHTDIGIFYNIVSDCNWIKVVFEDTNFTDTTIRVQNKILKVHKVILASASEAFQKMLADSSDNAIELSDVDFEDVSDILAYIYTGTAPTIRSRTSKILIAADRYGLKNLVSECVYELQQRFTPANIAKSLCLAEKLISCGHHLLKSSCIDFIKQNYISVYQSDSWKALKETYKVLALEIILEVLK